MISFRGVGAYEFIRLRRCLAIACLVPARQCAGTDQIDSMDDGDITKLYARYEAQLGAAMTKNLGQNVIQLYCGVASIFLSILLLWNVLESADNGLDHC